MQQNMFENNFNFSNLSKEKVLKNCFGLEAFRTGQLDIINSVLDGKDVIAVLPTGGGKSLCYQLPAVVSQKLVIVVSPLIALMKDQVANLNKKGIPAGALHSGQSDADKRAIFSALEKGGTYLLYLSPERVQKEGFQKWIRNKQIALFAIDEAHCVSQWGHDFREEYCLLKILKQIRPDVPILALTASATPTVLNDIGKQLNIFKAQRKVHGFYRPNLYYQVEHCGSEDDKLELIDEALNKFSSGRVIIYCGTRKNTEELAEMLQRKYSSVGCYHAGLTPKQRTQVQEDYSNSKLRILVATNAFGMGIDQPDVRLVIHYQIPANIDSLYQEMGRAGRDGLPSTCLLLYSRRDKGLQAYFITSSTADSQITHLRWRNLDALVQYSDSSECRHSEILTYYRDSQRIENCGHCDSCSPDSDRRVKRQVTLTNKNENLSTENEIPENIIKKITVKKLKSKVQSKAENVTVSKSKPSDEPLNQEQDLRFQLLRKWRKTKAQELDMPAFVVFGDQTLKHLAIKNPQTIEDLKFIYGIGDAKIEKYGAEIIEKLSE